MTESITASDRSIPSGPGGCFDAGVREGLIGLSRAFTHDFFDGRGQANLDLLSPNAVFLTPAPTQSSLGRDEYLRLNRLIREKDVRIVITRQSFRALPVAADQCCVLGLFHVFLNQGVVSPALRDMDLRLCFHWGVSDGEAELLVLESSFLVDIRQPAAPVEVPVEGPEAREAREVAPAAGEQLLEFRDDRRVSHFVDARSILYVEARSHKSVIHCEDDVFEVNEGITLIQERLGPGFVRLHRSYLVNPWHLRTLSKLGATLDDGEVLPVPKRRLPELRELLGWVRRPQALPGDGGGPEGEPLS